MYLNSVWLWNYVCICTFLHGGIAIFGGFPSFLLDATGPAAPAIGRSPATILLQSHQKWLQKDRLPPPRKKKHIFSDFQIKKKTIFRLSDPKNKYVPPERPPSSPLRTMHGTSDSRLQRPGAGCVWQGDGVSQKKLQKSSMVKFPTILRWFWFQTLNFNWILISTISWCCFKPQFYLVRLDFIKFWAVDS